MKFALITSLLLATSATLAADITVKHAWARATVPGQPVSGAFLEITAGKAAVLTGASSPAAAMVEVHEMKMEGGVMKMRQLDKLPLPAGQTVALKPGSYHLMLMQLKAPLKVGEQLPLVLHVEQDGKAIKLDTTAEVRGLAGN